MKLDKLHDVIGTILLSMVPLIYAFYVAVLAQSFGKFQMLCLTAGDSQAMALARSVLHVALSPGAFAAIAAGVLLRRQPVHRVRWGWGVFAWLWFSMALSLVLAPVFYAWAASQALWAVTLAWVCRATRRVPG